LLEKPSAGAIRADAQADNLCKKCLKSLVDAKKEFVTNSSVGSKNDSVGVRRQMSVNLKRHSEILPVQSLPLGYLTDNSIV
jgi:hypothetical protein